MERIWSSKEQRDAFFSELRELIGRYQNIGDWQFRKYNEDPEGYPEPDDGYPSFDPNSPMFLHSIVLIVTHTNMENWENLLLLDPFEQSMYATIGLVASANAILHDEGEE